MYSLLDGRDFFLCGASLQVQRHTILRPPPKKPQKRSGTSNLGLFG